MNEIWKPHVVVAAVIERDGRFLVIEEHTRAGIRLNQTLDEIREHASRHRSPLVILSIEDYLAGRRCSLDILRDCSA